MVTFQPKKTAILLSTYNILDSALKYSVQRIENDMTQMDPHSRYLIITDQGREGKMRKTTRCIQKINYIPSKFGTYAYRKEIQHLIEDPLPKDSAQSYFIQLSDLISYIVFLYGTKTILNANLSNRMPSAVDLIKIEYWLDLMKNSLNLKACSDNPYGILVHPK